MTKTPHPELCVTGLGLVTSVGHDHKTACASIRAGLKRSQLLGNYYLSTPKPFEDEDDGYVGGHPVLDGDYDNSPSRMAALLAMAFTDLNRQGVLDGLSEKPPLYLALPEKGRHTLDEPLFRDLILKHEVIPFFDEGFHILQHGHAGMIVAMDHAAKAMAKGRFSRALIAGTDSLIGFSDLSRFNRLGRLKTTLNPAGLMPGEAASVILLELTGEALKRKTKIHFKIKAFATETEEIKALPENPQSAKGLIRAMHKINAPGNKKPITLDTVISDINGESARSDELSMLHTQVLGRINGEKNMILPARCIGDTGAASPGVAFCIAARAMERRYLSYETENPSGLALVLSSSDTGERGVVLVEGVRIENG